MYIYTSYFSYLFWILPMSFIRMEVSFEKEFLSVLFIPGILSTYKEPETGEGSITICWMNNKKKMVRNQSWSPQLFFSPLHCCRCPWQCDFAVLPYEEVISGTFLIAQWLRLHSLNARGLHLIPGQGNRSHMPQLSVHTTTKTFPGTGK